MDRYEWLECQSWLLPCAGGGPVDVDWCFEGLASFYTSSQQQVESLSENAAHLFFSAEAPSLDPAQLALKLGVAHPATPMLGSDVVLSFDNGNCYHLHFKQVLAIMNWEQEQRCEVCEKSSCLPADARRENACACQLLPPYVVVQLKHVSMIVYPRNWSSETGLHQILRYSLLLHNLSGLFSINHVLLRESAGRRPISNYSDILILIKSVILVLLMCYVRPLKRRRYQIVMLQLKKVSLSLCFSCFQFETRRVFNPVFLLDARKIGSALCDPEKTDNLRDIHSLKQTMQQFWSKLECISKCALAAADCCNADVPGMSRLLHVMMQHVAVDKEQSLQSKPLQCQLQSYLVSLEDEEQRHISSIWAANSTQQQEAKAGAVIALQRTVEKRIQTEEALLWLELVNYSTVMD